MTFLRLANVAEKVRSDTRGLNPVVISLWTKDKISHMGGIHSAILSNDKQGILEKFLILISSHDNF